MLSMCLNSDIFNFFCQRMKVPFLFHLLQKKANNKTQYQNQRQILVYNSSAKWNIWKSPHVWQNILAYKESPGLVALNTVMTKGDFEESSSATSVLHYTALVNWQKCRHLVSSLLVSTGLCKGFFMTGVLYFCSNVSSNLVLCPFLNSPPFFCTTVYFCAVSRCQNNEHGGCGGWKQ